MSGDGVFLIHILEAARLIISFTNGIDFTAFQQDIKGQDAVIYRITVIGEATKRLSEPFRSSHPEIEWRKMAGMRDVLIHNYDVVNINRVWEVVQRDIPKLIQQLEPLIPPEDESKAGE
jgi:uncharacterized protein with HEPN domain